MRYLLKFKKLDNMIYISHLDLQRLFQRAMRRTGIRLQYSQGFNPHPKSGFVQALSLGQSSVSEYLEFETVDELDIAEVIHSLNNATPNGIELISIKEIRPEGKKIASYIVSADYLAGIPLLEKIEDNIAHFLSEKAISVLKQGKNKAKTIEIRGMIEDFSVSSKNSEKKNMILSIRVSTGSNKNLNPELMMGEFYRRYYPERDIKEIHITRTAIYGKKADQIIMIDDITEVPHIKW